MKEDFLHCTAVRNILKFPVTFHSSTKSDLVSPIFLFLDIRVKWYCFSNNVQCDSKKAFNLILQSPVLFQGHEFTFFKGAVDPQHMYYLGKLQHEVTVSSSGSVSGWQTQNGVEKESHYLNNVRPLLALKKSECK